LLRLVSAVLVEISDGWETEHIYLTMSRVATWGWSSPMTVLYDGRFGTRGPSH
jgi:hypothetical protein